jgi:hypothetical protein
MRKGHLLPKTVREKAKSGIYADARMQDDGDGEYTPVPGEPYKNPIARPKPYNVTLKKNKARKQRMLDKIN